MEGLASLAEEVVSLIETTTCLPDRVISARPYPGQQRHESWCVTLDSGSVLWLKVEREATRLAGVAREASFLWRNQTLPHLPRIVNSGVTEDGRSFILTEDLGGISLAELHRDAATRLTSQVAEWTATFGATAEVDPFPDSFVPAWELYGLETDVRRLLGPAQEWWSEARGSGLNSVPFDELGRCTSCRQGAVHGSMDPRNVLASVDGRLNGVVDFEATRRGCAAFDAAGFGLGLLDLWDLDAAIRWFECWAFATESESTSCLSGYLALRLWHRREAACDDRRDLSDSMRLVAHLVEHFGS